MSRYPGAFGAALNQPGPTPALHQPLAMNSQIAVGTLYAVRSQGGVTIYETGFPGALASRPGNDTTADILNFMEGMAAGMSLGFRRGEGHAQRCIRKALGMENPNG